MDSATRKDEAPSEEQVSQKEEKENVKEASEAQVRATLVRSRKSA